MLFNIISMFLFVGRCWFLLLGKNFLLSRYKKYLFLFFLFSYKKKGPIQMNRANPHVPIVMAFSRC